VTLPYSGLNGGYLLVSSLDEAKKVIATELLGETRSGRTSLTMLNGLSLPVGCSMAKPTDPACHRDSSSASPVPGAAKQHSLYAPYIEDSPAQADLIVVNVSDAVAKVAFTTFADDGAYRTTWPSTGFRNLQPNEVLRVVVQDVLGSNRGVVYYVRIEDPDSAIVGVVTNRDQANKYKTVLPLVPDAPQLAQINSDSFLSRIQLDPSSANPRLTTGLIILNPNDKEEDRPDLEMTIIVTDSNGRATPFRAAVPTRGIFSRARNSLSVPFTVSGVGYAEVVSTSQLDAGQGGRLIVIAVYRSKDSVSSVMEQSKSP
jgi:hypothetical protein